MSGARQVEDHNLCLPRWKTGKTSQSIKYTILLVCYSALVMKLTPRGLTGKYPNQSIRDSSFHKVAYRYLNPRPQVPKVLLELTFFLLFVSLSLSSIQGGKNQWGMRGKYLKHLRQLILNYQSYFTKTNQRRLVVTGPFQ